MTNSDSRPLTFAAVDHRRLRGRAFGILPPDLLRHVHVLGQTGMGKSALLERLVLELVARGEGCAVLDPHGDLVTRLLDRIPPSRTNDVVLLDAGDSERAMGWNPLDHRDARDRPRLAAGVVSTFRKVFCEFWGPRLEHVLRHALVAVLATPGTTLLSVLRVLVDEHFRTRLVARVDDPLTRFYWTREFPAYGAGFAAEVIAPVQNKITAALASPALRAILGQSRSTTSAREIMDGARVLLVDLAKGRVGDAATSMLGAVLTTSFELAAYARSDAAPEARRRFTLLIDECGSVVTDSLATGLAEARKYGLALVLAHQYLGQLDTSLREALVGNAGTTIAFRLGADDAEELAREFAPEVEARDLVRLEAHQIALRLSVRGTTTRAFTAATFPPVDEGLGRGVLVRRVSDERYTRPRSEVEAEVVEALGLERELAASRSKPGTNLRLRLGS